MKISINWLRKYLDINIPPDELINKLIGIGFDLESVENQAELLKNFVIGKVISREKHPNADKLSVCKVEVGGPEILNIVCGAPNVDAGQTVCVARVGAIVPNGGFEIKKSKIRGEVSEGMICSAKEMDMGEDHSGIMVLKEGTPIGSSFAEYLGKDDVVFDIGVTPNRGDLLSHLGVAREAGFVLKQQVKEPAIIETFEGDEISDYISVDIENPDGCYRYCGTLVKNVKIKESPDWLKNCLTAVGLRPINNIVDITNFVMMESGQPLHAFDYDVIAGKKIIVKNAGSEKKFTTLDGKERELRDNVLLICDAERPVALAGIMGGANSEITNKTTSVFIESANFNPIITRYSSKFLGLQTDSSYRFERGIDIDMTIWAAKRAAELMQEFAGGTIAAGIIDNYPNRKSREHVSLRNEYLNKKTGIEFSLSQAKELLEGIGIMCLEEKADSQVFEIPYFRAEDVKREIDLVEEVLRLYGYDKITDSEYNTIPNDFRMYSTSEFDSRNELRTYFENRGFKEIVTNSLLYNEDVKLISDKYVELSNPSSNLMDVLRTDLITGALGVVNYNFNRQVDSVKLFEIGTVFNKDADKKENLIYSENIRKILIMAGVYDKRAIGSKDRFFDIFDMKGEVEMLLGKLNIDNYDLNDYYYKEYYDIRCDYSVRNELFASVQQLSKSFLKKHDIEKPVIICEIY